MRSWRRLSAYAALTVTAALGGQSLACPFCTAPGPSLAQRRDVADLVVLGEAVAGHSDKTATFRVHRALKGAKLLGKQQSIEATADAKLSAGTLALLFGAAGEGSAAENIGWSTVAVNETSLGYFAAAPPERDPPARRLRYFAGYLEHRDATMADDAYRELARASFDDVAPLADRIEMDRLRAWLADPNVPQSRKGLYGLLLGVTKDKQERLANAQFLRGEILKPSDEFRAGFDGLLGGYLLLSGEEALALLEERYLHNADAPGGDVRHALTAVRFYRQYGQQIPVERLCRAIEPTLARPELAASIITDLGRWKDWRPVKRIAGLYGQDDYREKSIRRAIVGYLLACPEKSAAEALAALRKTDATGVAAAQQELSLLGGAPQKE